MHLVSSLLFAISANIDSFIIGFLYGVKKTHLSFGIKLIISVITCIGTVLSIGLGMQLVNFIPVKTAQILGSLLLIVLGFYYVMKDFIKKKQCDNRIIQVAEKEKYGISIKEAAVVGLALSVNNMGMGIGISVSGVHLVFTSVMTLVLSLLFLVVGNHMGKFNHFKFVSKYADSLSGVIIIVLGIYEFFI